MILWKLLTFCEADQTVNYDLVPKTNKDRIGVVVFLIVGPIPWFCLYTAVQHMPMGDIAALSALCPVAAYIVARVVLKHQFTILKVCVEISMPGMKCEIKNQISGVLLLASHYWSALGCPTTLYVW